MPDLSVIVATRNRPSQLRGCLASLARSTLTPNRLEVVVVDDGGDAPIEGVVDGASGRLAVRLISIRHGGAGAARNAGARVASAPAIAFTDDDCVVHADWAKRMHAAVAANPRTLFGGRTLNGLPGNPYAAMSQRILDAVYAWANADPDDGRFLTSNNMAVDREAFIALGGFDETFRVAAEDRELCDRWRWTGGRIGFVTDAVVEHHKDLDLLRFASQHFGYGRGANRYHRVRGARGVASIRDEIGFVLEPRRWPWSAGPESPATDRARDSALVLLWQAANAAGYATEGLRSALGRAFGR